MTPEMLNRNMHNAGLEAFFEHVISTDRANELVNRTNAPIN